MKHILMFSSIPCSHIYLYLQIAKYKGFLIKIKVFIVFFFFVVVFFLSAKLKVLKDFNNNKSF